MSRHRFHHHHQHDRTPPHWWPEGEAWPPAAARRFGTQKTFMRRVAILVGGLFLLMFAVNIVAVILFGGWGEGRGPEGSGGPPGPIRFIGLIILVVVVLKIARKVRQTAAPIGAVMEAADRVAGGDYAVRVNTSGSGEVGRLVSSFNEMAARLQTNEEQRRSLLADIAHELRTPLSVIRGNVEGMIDGVYPRDDAHLAPILEETTVMNRLLDDLRTLAMAEAGALRLYREATDLGGLVPEVVAAHLLRAGAMGITLSQSVPELPELEIDPVRVHQVLDNLLTNALRHTPPGGAIGIEARVVDRNVAFAVTDTGRGIAPEDLPYIFDRFTKSADSGGSGLGLAIVKSLIEAHGGEIWAKSQRGQGTTIHFTLPIETPVVQPRPSPAATVPPMPRPGVRERAPTLAPLTFAPGQTAWRDNGALDEHLRPEPAGSSIDDEQRMTAMTTKKRYLATLPERLLRASAALGGGAIYEISGVALPRVVRHSKLYQATIHRMLRVLVELVGDVKGVYPSEVMPVGELAKRKIAGNAVELASVLAVGWSPLWFLAAASDLTGGSKAYLRTLVSELEGEKLLRPGTDVSSYNDLLTQLETTTGTLADAIDVPPLSMSGARQSWETLQRQTDDLPSADSLASLYNELQATAQREGLSVSELSGAVGMAAARAGLELGNVHLVDYYREAFGAIANEGYLTFLRRVTHPYIRRTGHHFNPAVRTYTDRALGWLERQWQTNGADSTTAPPPAHATAVPTTAATDHVPAAPVVDPELVDAAAVGAAPARPPVAASTIESASGNGAMAHIEATNAGNLMSPSEAERAEPARSGGEPDKNG